MYRVTRIYLIMIKKRSLVEYLINIESFNENTNTLSAVRFVSNKN